jgi:4-hydroxyacetophenone monooxygenase
VTGTAPVPPPATAAPDPELAARASREADPGVLGAVLAQLTGDLRWATDGRLVALRHGHGDGGYLDEAADALTEVCRAGTVPADPGDDRLLEIARSALDPALGPEDVPTLRHHLWPRESRPVIDPADAARAGLHVTIIGAGMSGLGLAFALAETGIEYTVLERRAGLGGVWLDNDYPDAGVDTQAFQYAFESMPHADWSRFDAKRDEILAYIRSAAEKTGVLDRIEFGTEVSQARWTGDRWQVRTTRGGTTTEVGTDVVVSAVGALNRPKIPRIPGLDGFDGPVFHTAEWDPGTDLTGLRVALVGNGSSGTQVGRAIADRAGRLIAFQRTPHWIRPRNPREAGPVGDGKRWLVGHLPHYLGWYRFRMNIVTGDGEHPTMVRAADAAGRLVPNGRNHGVRAELERYLRERLAGRPDLIEALTPGYPPYGKRLVIDNGWYDTLTRPHVDLVTDGIAQVVPDGVVTVDGRHHAVDAIVFATGFHGTRYFWPMEILGRSGRPLVEEHGGPENIRAHLGVAMPGYPNLFALQGPNSSVGHGGGVTFMSECQGRFVLGCLKIMIERGARTLEIRRAVADRYNAEMDAALEQMVWSSEGLDSRYHNAEGRIVMNHPWTIGRFWELTRTVRPDDLLLG